MPYCFQPDESIQAAARRLSAERAQGALGWLQTLEKPESLHEIRKEIKKYRAVLRLFRPELGTRLFDTEMALLRDAAAQLGNIRDAWVQVQVFDELAQQAGLSAKSVEPLRLALQHRADGHATDVLQAKTARALHENFSKLEKHASRYAIEARGWLALERGIRWSYSRGLKACEAAASDPSAEALHAWRRRVKDLWYHCRLLTPSWPGYFESVCAMLKQLARLLGEDHDLDLLAQRLDELPQRKERRVLKTLIQKRRSELQTAAFSLGARLYAEKPSAFCRRLEGIWRAWQAESVSLKH